MRVISLILTLILFSIGVSAQTGKKEYNSYKGLVMAGYQGWFNAPDDGANRGWYHYKGRQGFRPGSCSVDMWPDVTEYEKTYKTAFVLADGSPAYVFSSHDESTVRTHFRWMKEYGIDGVFMQRFVSEIRGNSGKHHFNTVLASAMKSANEYSRAICVMYDLSGMRPGDEQMILNDIDEIAAKHALKDHKANPSYLYHNGKPLVTIWGVGFNDKRNYGLNEVETIISGLKSKGFSVMLGVPTHWRTLSGDTTPDAKLHELIRRCDIIMPWFVGRYNETNYDRYHEQIKEDLKWAKKEKVDYAPLAFPGFTWKNLKGMHTTQIGRNKGNFLWKQLSGAIQAGAGMIYVAMFDEIDEGTAIFKCAKRVPIGQSYFLPIDTELGTDHYLWLVGQAGKMLRKEMPLSVQQPQRTTK
ncbi:glycoside hydrolase family 71/99-like protein [Bacteroides sp. 51]|uniref:glycoside hydrolase family 71/99-like protein n=1 Tax=Bacteroides sp. 51 TaxID=2302938 RepID=UPI0013D4CA8B|nr:glycoside hydrolase family 71/99-like protein [Bacteroides sp. 51]NDV81777.1 xylosidase [Bacteroides sp. 51]